MIFERIFGLAMVALALLIWYLAHRADDEVEASVNRALGPVVPLDDLPHEQDSAEAYDDTPEQTFRTIPGARVISRAEYEAMEPEPGVWYWICDFYDADGERLRADVDVRPSDDAVAALHDMSVDEFRARLREQQVAVSAAVAAQRLDVEIFDLCHDARTGGAS